MFCTPPPGGVRKNVNHSTTFKIIVSSLGKKRLYKRVFSLIHFIIYFSKLIYFSKFGISKIFNFNFFLVSYRHHPPGGVTEGIVAAHTNSSIARIARPPGGPTNFKNLQAFTFDVSSLASKTPI